MSSGMDETYMSNHMDSTYMSVIYMYGVHNHLLSFMNILEVLLRAPLLSNTSDMPRHVTIMIDTVRPIYYINMRTYRVCAGRRI